MLIPIQTTNLPPLRRLSPVYRVLDTIPLPIGLGQRGISRIELLLLLFHLLSHMSRRSGWRLRRGLGRSRFHRSRGFTRSRGSFSLALGFIDAGLYLVAWRPVVC